MDRPKDIVVRREFTQTARCTGHCCAGFIIGDSPKHKDLMNYLNGTTFINGRQDEGPKIAEMLILLPRNKWRPWKTGPKATELRPTYTCKWFDGTNCTNYENRPNLCRDHPPPNDTADDGHCSYEGCTRRIALTKVTLPILRNGHCEKARALMKRSADE